MIDIEMMPALLEQKPLLANLLELYAHDFSEFMDLQLGIDGRFGYKHLDLYWQEPHRYPFLVRVNRHLAGFVLVRQGSEISHDQDVWDMTEFFIVRGYRRRGIGRKAAHEVWKKLPGKWEVRFSDRNQRAKDFWRCVIGEFLDRRLDPTAYDQNGECWHVFSFESDLANINLM